jgi:hypothetical protein
VLFPAPTAVSNPSKVQAFFVPGLAGSQLTIYHNEIAHSFSFRKGNFFAEKEKRNTKSVDVRARNNVNVADPKPRATTAESVRRVFRQGAGVAGGQDRSDLTIHDPRFISMRCWKAKAMAQQSLQSKKGEILGKLEAAGAPGLGKGALGIKHGKSLGARALKALEQDRKIANLGTQRKTRYVLAEFYRPLELACGRIEWNAKEAGSSRSGVLDLLSRKDLEKGCEGEVRKKVDEAIAWLVKERRLFGFRRGRSIFFVHAEKVRGAAPGIPAAEPVRAAADAPAGPPPVSARLDRREILAAYQRLARRLGYSNVEISGLRREAGCSMDSLKGFLVEESRQGRAVLSLGDWSVSSEETRAGAIELFGKPHLLVRLDAE